MIDSAAARGPVRRHPAAGRDAGRLLAGGPFDLVLRELHVKNIAVVAAASVELGPGLNALTGETGAGKSIVVDSLALLAGARASTDLVRSGAETLTVTGIFEPAGEGWRRVLEEAGLEASDELLVRREVNVGGRNRVFVNDQPATVRLLAELAPELLSIHGQREELGLVAPDLQRHWLDLSGGAEADELVGRVSAAYEGWRRLAERMESLAGDAEVRRQRIETLAFQAREIDAGALEEGEQERLTRERESLRHRETLCHSLGGAVALLLDDEEAAAGRLARSRALLREIDAWEPRAAGWAAEVEEVRIRLEEVTRELRQRLAEIEADPDRLNAVEDRLAVVERLCRRYGGTTAGVLARRREIAAEVAELEGTAASRETLEAEAAAALDAYRRAAGELSAARAQWGQALARRMEAELADLGLGKAKLQVRLGVRRRRDSPLVIAGEGAEFGPHGIEQVLFEFAANPGEELRSLSRAASGGELSRLYLALKLAVGSHRQATAPTLVFDEVDAGVGGAQAAALGKKLQRLAAAGQILVVTHLPQVASHADRHFRVTKSQRRERTYTEVEPLDDEARVEETARMLAGSRVTELSRSHARELLAASSRDGAG